MHDRSRKLRNRVTAKVPGVKQMFGEVSSATKNLGITTAATSPKSSAAFEQVRVYAAAHARTVTATLFPGLQELAAAKKKGQWAHRWLKIAVENTGVSCEADASARRRGPSSAANVGFSRVTATGALQPLTEMTGRIGLAAYHTASTRYDDRRNRQRGGRGDRTGPQWLGETS
jgi:hypothetical protein